MRISRPSAVAVAILVVGAIAGCTATTGTSTGQTASPSAAGAALQVQHPAPRAEAITHGPRDKPVVAITIDADFSPSALERTEDGRFPRQVNDEIMDFLGTSKVPATVFVTGMWAKEYPEELATLNRNPNIELANHTWTHDAWTDDCYELPYVESTSEKESELKRTNNFVYTKTDQQLFWFRFPGLCHNQSDLDLVAKNGMQAVDADVEVDDAFADDGEATAAAMLEDTKQGSILLLHLNGEPNAPVSGVILKELVAGLKKKGLRPVTLQTMFAP